MHERTFDHYPGSFTGRRGLERVTGDGATVLRSPSAAVQHAHPKFGTSTSASRAAGFSPRRLAPGELADVLTRWQDTLGTRRWNALYLGARPAALVSTGDPSRYWPIGDSFGDRPFLQHRHQGQEIGMLGGDCTAALVSNIESVSYALEAPRDW